MTLLHRIEAYLNRHLAYWLTNGCHRHRVEQYQPSRQKDYKIRNERIKWLQRIIGTSREPVDQKAYTEEYLNGCRTFEQIEAARNLAELFARHHNEKLSKSLMRQLNKRERYLNLER